MEIFGPFFGLKDNVRSDFAIGDLGICWDLEIKGLASLNKKRESCDSLFYGSTFFF
ncbi:hypothetical protein D3C87_104450 [compost metagenome]